MNKNLTCIAPPPRLLAKVTMIFLASMCFGNPVHGAIFVKADNATDLDLSTSWLNAAVPGSADTAVWDNTFSAVNNSANLGAPMTWSGILFSNNLQAPFTINATGANALTIGTGGINLSNANNSLTINSPVIQGGNETWNINAGQALTFNGSVFGNTATASGTFNLTMTGSGTVNFNGNYSEAGNDNNAQTLIINSNTVNINPGLMGSFVTARKIILGNIPGSTTILNIQSGTNAFIQTNYFAMADSTTTQPNATNENSFLNISGGQTYINTTGSPFVLGLKGYGTVNVGNSTLVIGANTPFSIGSYSSSGFPGAIGTLNVNSGATVFVTNSSQVFAVGNGGPSSSGTGNVNLYAGGTLISGRNISRPQANAKGFVTFNGGTLKAGLNSTTFLQGLTAATISTNGGTIDDGGFTVTIAQPLLHDATLTTDGGLTKQGAGTLTLSSTNTYNGATTVNAGTLVISPASAGAPGNYTVAGSGKLTVRAGVAGAQMAVNAMTFNAGSILTLDETSLSVPLIIVTNALAPASTVTVNLTNMTITAGEFPLISYGSLGGVGIGGFVLGSVPTTVGVVLSLTNDVANHSIDLLATTATSLTWNGNISGAWDIGLTANWQGGQFYAQSGGNGPAVNFDDTASGTTAITLNTAVSPSGVLVNNSSLTYGISGSGNISGSGPLIKLGSGTFTLATANTMTNLTTVSSGTLQLGDGTASNGSVGGSILDNAALVVANPNPQTMNNTISGSGSLTKSGNGTLTLTSSNLLGGPVTVSAGTLALNQGGAGASGIPVLGSPSSVSVAPGAILSLAGANTFGVSNAVLPSLILAGGSSLIATGAGTQFVSGLALGDSSAGSSMSGSGGVYVNGNLTNASASTVSLGSLSINGTNILLTDGSSLTVGNLNLSAPPSPQEWIGDGPGFSGGDTLTVTGNVNVTMSSLQMDYMTWNFNLGTNTFFMNGKLTIGKNSFEPADVVWNSGTGLITANNYFAMADAPVNIANPSQGELDVNGGSLVISNSNSGRILLGNAGVATVNVSGGSLSFLGNDAVQLGGDSGFPQNNASGTLTISGSGSVVVGPQCGLFSLAANRTNFTGITGTINLNGGILQTWPGITNGATGAGASSCSAVINFNGGTLKAGTNNEIGRAHV